MTSLSKFPSEMITMRCRVLGHPETENCFIGALNNFLASVVGSGGFYSFLFFCQLLSKYIKKKKKPSIKEYLKAVSRSTLSSALIIFNASISYCILRKILGRFYYYTIAFIPSFIGGFSLLLETEKVKGFFASSLSNGILEYLLLDKGIRNLNKTQQTFIFMSVSSILSYLLCVTNYKQQYFWFFIPQKNSLSERECEKKEKCSHESHCAVYISKLFTIYFTTGLVLQNLRYLSKNFQNLNSIIFSLLKIKNLKLATFLGTYALIYQSVRCFFLKTTNKYNAVHDLIAGLLAGTTFRFQPNIPILNSGIICIIQILFQVACDYNLLPPFPYKEIVLVLCVAFIFHVKIFFHEKCPGFIRHLVSSISNKKADRVREDYIRIFIDRNSKNFHFKNIK